MPKSLFSINLIALTLILTVNFLRAQEHAAYLIFNNKGEKVDYEQVKKKSAENEVVFFGELHNNPISHWLQLKLTSDLFDLKDGKLILGAE
ncbi:MAG: ChaN family lipoprotein, partial [Bacteroidota bacterium]